MPRPERHTVAALMLTLILASQAGAYERRTWIYINGDSALNAENGVVNPEAAGTAEDPLRISGWRIDDGYSGAQIFIEGTTRCLRIEGNRLENAPVAILVYQASCVSIAGNTIEDIRAVGTVFGGDGETAVGIFIQSSENVIISGNELSEINAGFGALGMFGWAGGFLPGGQGGDAGDGGLGVAIYLNASSDVTVSDNNLSYLYGGAGGAGGAGGQGVPGGRGGHGGNGGDAYGIHLDNCSDVTLKDNLLSTLYGAAGGAGGAGGFSGADGGNGGQGGGAIGLVLMHSDRIALSGNRIITLYGGIGAAGAAGAWGGPGAVKGGNGGIGGITGGAVAVSARFCREVTIENSTIDDLWGAAGPASGAGAKGAGIMLTPTEGGRGGSGSSGGAAVAFRFVNSEDIQILNNRISDLRGGAGAVGSAGGYAGGDAGRGGNGGWGAAGMLVASARIETLGNTIESLWGGGGGAGAAGAAGVAEGGLGGDGGRGGSAVGFYFANSSGILARDDNCDGLRGAAGGTGGTGGAYNLLTTMAQSGDGGHGGDGACLVFWQSPDNSHSGIQASDCSGGWGALGAMGGGENGREGSAGPVIVK